MSASWAFQALKPVFMTTTTAAVTVDMMAVAAIISSSDKPRNRFLAARLRNITHQLGYFRCHRRAGFARIHSIVAVVIAVCGDSHDHQLTDDAAVDGRVGASDAEADSRLAVGGKVPGYGPGRPGGNSD